MKMEPWRVEQVNAEFARWQANFEAHLRGGRWPAMERLTGSIFVVQLPAQSAALHAFDPVI